MAFGENALALCRITKLLPRESVGLVIDEHERFVRLFEYGINDTLDDKLGPAFFKQLLQLGIGGEILRRPCRVKAEFALHAHGAPHPTEERAFTKSLERTDIDDFRHFAADKSVIREAAKLIFGAVPREAFKIAELHEHMRRASDVASANAGFSGDKSRGGGFVVEYNGAFPDGVRFRRRIFIKYFRIKARYGQLGGYCAEKSFRISEFKAPPEHFPKIICRFFFFRRLVHPFDRLIRHDVFLRRFGKYKLYAASVAVGEKCRKNPRKVA